MKKDKNSFLIVCVGSKSRGYIPRQTKGLTSGAGLLILTLLFVLGVLFFSCKTTTDSVADSRADGALIPETPVSETALEEAGAKDLPESFAAPEDPRTEPEITALPETALPPSDPALRESLPPEPGALVDLPPVPPVRETPVLPLVEPSLNLPEANLPLPSISEVAPETLPEPPLPELTAPELPPAIPAPEIAVPPVLPVTPAPGDTGSVEPAPLEPVEPETPPPDTAVSDATPVPDVPEPPAAVAPAVPPVFLRSPEDAAPLLPREEPMLPLNPPPEVSTGITPFAGEEELVFSRTLRAAVGQLVEIPFRGAGWVYLGEIGSRRGVAYESRRLDLEGQSFIFRAEVPGVYVLKFYRQDFLRDFIMNDHVQVIVDEAVDTAGGGLFNAPVDRGRVIAEPRWPLPEDPPPAQSQQPSAPSDTPLPAEVSPAVPVSPTSAVEALSPPLAAAALPEEAADTLPLPDPLEGLELSEYLRLAKEDYDAGRVESALAALNKLSERFPSGADEAYWLYGQLLEAGSPSRDIRRALDYYRRLVREFPQSPRVPEAQRRIAYLERFYFNIR